MNDAERKYREWRENYEKYRTVVLAKADPSSKQYQAAMRPESEIRALWFRRFEKPRRSFSDE